MSNDNNVDLKGRPNKEILDALGAALEGIDLEGIDPEGSGFRDLPDGYFLLEVKNCSIGFSKSNNLQAKFQLTVVEDGYDMDVNKNGETVFKRLKGTKNQNVFKYFSLTDGTKVQRFANDMVKFEGDEAGKSLLPKEAFTDSSMLVDALEVLEAMHSRIWSKNDVTVNDDGTKSSWLNFLSWKRAKELGLPIE